MRRLRVYRCVLPITANIQLTLFGAVTVRTRRGERPATNKEVSHERKHKIPR